MFSRSVLTILNLITATFQITTNAQTYPGGKLSSNARRYASKDLLAMYILATMFTRTFLGVFQVSCEELFYMSF